MIFLSKEQFSYLIVTFAYWVFMLSDGALRMLVLLHFHQNGFSPLQLAYLFLFYELAGIFTNPSAGWLAARYGLKLTLYAGLTVQIISLYSLSQLNENWSQNFSIFYVLIVQGLSGIAKDLTKMSSKSAVKLLAPDNQSSLFKWVAILTGSKNAVKGFGFLLGCALLATIGFYNSLISMVVIVTFILVCSFIFLKNDLINKNNKAKIFDVFSKSKNINFLSAARIFLFGARDVWFVVGLPIFFYSVFSDGSVDGNKKAFFIIGSFMAAWIILYGIIQAYSPKLFLKEDNRKINLVDISKNWVLYLLINLILLTFLLFFFSEIFLTTIFLFSGLFIFCGIFAVNSSIHSYLILHFSKMNRVSLDVGFYYMANATGRFFGTLLSGLSYQFGGLTLSLALSTIMIAFCLYLTSFLQESYNEQKI